VGQRDGSEADASVSEETTAIEQRIGKGWDHAKDMSVRLETVEQHFTADRCLERQRRSVM